LDINQARHKYSCLRTSLIQHINNS
jgi:hypothetical protein